MGAFAGPEVVEDGLVLCLDAANPKSYPGSGTTWTDLSGNGNNATLVNGVGYSNENNGCLTFDGSNQYVSVNNSSSLNPSVNTVICWAKSDTENWNDSGFLMSKRFVFIVHPLINEKSVVIYYWLNNTWLSGAAIVPTNIMMWNMYAGSWNGTAISTYLNGNKIASTNRSGSLNTSDTGVLEIGKDDGYSRYLNGNISMCFLYNRVLTDNEVKQNYLAIKARYSL